MERSPIKDVEIKTFGFRVNNDAFEKNSWYFRNALVRAIYTNLQKGIDAGTHA